MRAIARSLACSVAVAALIAVCLAQITSRFNDTIAAMAAALAENNAPGFLAHVDRSLPGYDKLKANVEALVNQAEVHSGVNQISEEGDELTVDWELQMAVHGSASQHETRRATLTMKFVQNGSRWKLKALDDLNFFAPPAGAE